MRYDSITISKGIAIILMVAVHSRFSPYGRDLITMFHMPLFFFFSGYCFKDAYINDFKTFAGKRIKGIYYPYVKWGMIFLLLHNFFFIINVYNAEIGFRGVGSYLYSVHDIIKRGVDIVVGLSSAEQLLGGYWFLHTLFFCSFIFYLFVKTIKNRWLGGGVLLIITFLLLLLNIHIPVFGIGSKEFLGAFFMMIGCAYKQSKLVLEKKLYIIPVAIIILVIGTKYWQCGMLTLTWHKVLPYSLSALFGTLMVFSISNILLSINKVSKFLIYVGDHTLEILTWHFLSFKLISLLLIWLYGLPIERLAEFPVIEDCAYQGWWVAYCFMGVCVPLFIIKCKWYLKTILKSNV